MKIFKMKFYHLTISCLIGCLAFSSCKKDDGDTNACGGNPSITNIVMPDRVTTVSEGNYNQFIIIRGENLCSLKKLMFNDVEVSINQIYATSNEISVKIPNNAPEEITNKLTVETVSGQVVYDFPVIVPPIAIKSVDNEYAPVGTTMILVGQSFDFGGYTQGKGKILFGTKEAVVTRATVDSLIVTVPEGATEGDIIKGVDKRGTEFTYQYPYKDQTNMVVNYDDKPTAAWSRVNYVVEDANSISGKYAHFVETPVRTGFAQDQFFKGKVTLPQDAVANPGNYVIKFEVFTTLPVTRPGIRIMADNAAAGNFYAWSPTASVPFDTKGKWITHSISLLAAHANKAPLAARANNLYELRGIVTNGTANVDMDISFDNWRVVAKPQ